LEAKACYVYGMKQLRSIFVALVAIIGLVALPVSVAADNTQYVNNEDINVAQAALDSLNTFTSALSNTAVTLPTVISDGMAAQTQLTDLGKHGFVTSLGDKYTQATDALKQDSTLISTDIGNIDTALQANDITKANSYVTPLNHDIDQFNSDTELLNSGVDTHNTQRSKTVKTQSGLYLGLLIAAVVLAVASFGWYKRSVGDPDVVTRARRSVALASIWPLIGAAITYISFRVASKNGGTYIIAYGPILFGVLAYVRVVANYKRIKMRASNAPQQTIPTSPLPPSQPAVSPVVPVATPVTNPMPVINPVPPATPVAVTPPTVVTSSDPPADPTNPTAPTVL
jgi:hypothetical protein